MYSISLSLYIYIYIFIYTSLSSLSLSIYLYIHIHITIYIYIYIYRERERERWGKKISPHVREPIPETRWPLGKLAVKWCANVATREAIETRTSKHVHSVHLSRVSLLRVLESNFLGDPLSNYTDMRIPSPEN